MYPTASALKPSVVLLGLNGLVLHIFVPCLEFLYQVGASSANSNPGADEHDGLFWKFMSGEPVMTDLVSEPG